MNATNNFNLDSTREDIIKRNKIFAEAMANSNASGVADCYTIDAEFMAPGADSICGRENIKKTMQGYINDGFTQYEVIYTTVYGDKDVIGVQSIYSLSKINGADKDIGKTIQLWKKEDGTWKIFRDCFNSNLPGNS